MKNTLKTIKEKIFGKKYPCPICEGYGYYETGSHEDGEHCEMEPVTKPCPFRKNKLYFHEESY